jgi:hypothetical protein
MAHGKWLMANEIHEPETDICFPTRPKTEAENCTPCGKPLEKPTSSKRCNKGLMGVPRGVAWRAFPRNGLPATGQQQRRFTA